MMSAAVLREVGTSASVNFWGGLFRRRTISSPNIDGDTIGRLQVFHADFPVQASLNESSKLSEPQSGSEPSRRYRRSAAA